MNRLLITNARLVNEGATRDADVLIEGERISKIAPSIDADGDIEIIDDALKDQESTISERDNISVSGYGVKAFALSMVQAAVTATSGPPTSVASQPRSVTVQTTSRGSAAAVTVALRSARIVKMRVMAAS